MSIMWLTEKRKITISSSFSSWQKGSIWWCFHPEKKVRCGDGKLQMILSWLDWFTPEKSLEILRKSEDLLKMGEPVARW